jgi:hypothetical protein
MTTKKILLIIVGILGVLGLLVVLFVVGIGWFVFRTIGTSEAADTARAYLRASEPLKRDIGEVKDFGSLVSGELSRQDASGEATLHLKVIGERKTVNAIVELSHRSNRGWRVTAASYESGGRTIDLVSPYESDPEPSPPPN